MGKTYLKDMTEIAAITETSRQTVKKWLSRADAPKRERAGWRTDAILPYCREMKARALAAQTGRNCDLKRVKLEKEIDLLTERISTEQIATASAKLDYAKKNGELIPRDEHNEQLLKLAGIVKTTLENLPMDLLHVIPAIGADGLKVLETKIDNVLRILSEETRKENL